MRSLGVALWCLFGLLVLGGGWLFLRACGTRPDLVWSRNFCPAPPDHSRMMREAEVGDGLQRQVHAAEMRLAEMPPCPPPRPNVPTPTPMPMPTRPQPQQQRAESQSMDRRVERRGGKRGRLQLTLSWATTDDLDINVDCPGGQISSYAGHRGPGICGGGVKDIDANGDLVRNVSSTPVENVSWAADVPEGTYLITIIEYKARAPGGNDVPFSLRMRYGDEEKICHDVVSEWAPSQYRREGRQLFNGTYRTISWRTGEPLPDCNFKVEESIRGGRQK